MKKRLALLLIAVLAIGLMPGVAGAQTSEELAAIDELEASCALTAAAETTEEFVVAAAAMEEAIVVMKAVFPDLDYAALDAAHDALEAAIVGGDLDAINAAGDAAVAECTAVAAAAAEAASGGEEGEDGDGTEEPTAVDTGGPVSDGPNVAMLGVAALLALFAGAAIVVRRSYDRS